MLSDVFFENMKQLATHKNWKIVRERNAYNETIKEARTYKRKRKATLPNERKHMKYANNVLAAKTYLVVPSLQQTYEECLYIIFQDNKFVIDTYLLVPIGFRISDNMEVKQAFGDYLEATYEGTFPKTDSMDIMMDIFHQEAPRETILLDTLGEDEAPPCACGTKGGNFTMLKEFPFVHVCCSNDSCDTYIVSKRILLAGTSVNSPMPYAARRELVSSIIERRNEYEK